MNSQPKISVIISVHNNENFLEKCLNSIRLQTYPNLEIICINDGSTDNSLAILNEYKNIDERISVFSQDYVGDGIAFNTGLNNATGNYVSFINPNDWAFLTLYQTFVDAINRVQNDIDIYLYNTGVYDYEVNDVVQQPVIDLSDWNIHFSEDTVHSFNDCQKPFNNTLGLYNKIFRKEFLLNNQINFIEFLHFGEMYFVFKSLLSAKTILLNDDILARERFLKIPMTSKVFDIFKVLDLFDAEIDKHNVYDSFKYAFFQFKYNICLEHYAGCPKDNKESYYNNMKFWLLASENPDLDKGIIQHLKNYGIFESVKKYTRKDFDKFVKI